MAAMRRLRLSLGLLLVLALAACGGDDDTSTPTQAPATPTTAGTPVAPPAPGATGTPGAETGSGGGAGGGAGGTAVSVDATPTGPAAATATRRPATVVSTPRPIATQRPQPTQPAQATATPEPDDTPVPMDTPEDGQLLVVMEEDFESGTSEWFETGTTEFNTTLAIVDGWYVLSPAAESWQTLTVSPDESWFFADGLIVADVSLDAGAEFGLVSRQMQDESGTFYFYVCWLTPTGAAGCSTYTGGEFTLLFRQDDPALVQEVNTMVMQVIGTELIYEVNDVQIGAIDDATIEAGYWGFYVWGDASLPSARVDYVAIAVP